MKKTILITLTVILIVVVAAALGKNFMAKAAVENGVEFITGLKLRMQSLDVNLGKTFVGIKDLRLFNPPGFKDPTMAELPEIYVDYDMPALFKGETHLEEVRIHLKEFVVIKNEKGELNLDSLRALQATQKEGAAKGTAGPAGEAPAPKIQIDRLRLKAEKAIYKDYSGGGEPSVKEYPLNLDEEYKNITNPNYIATLIVLRIMMNTPLASLTHFDIGVLQGPMSDVLASSQQMAGQTAEKAEEALQQTSQAAQDLLKKAEGMKEATGMLEEKAQELTGGLKDAATGLKDKLKMPFGKSEQTAAT